MHTHKDEMGKLMKEATEVALIYNYNLCSAYINERIWTAADG